MASRKSVHAGKRVGDGKPGERDLTAFGIGLGKQPTPQVPDDTPDFSGVEVSGNTEALGMLPVMVATLREKEARAAAALLASERAAADLAHFQMVVLPEAMELAGVAEYKLTDGSVLKVKDDLKAAIPKEDVTKRANCFEWLRTNGHGAIIKTFFDVDVRALTDKQRESLRKAIEKKGVHADVKQDVHWQTLKSLVKELLEKGTELPPDFSIHQFKKAELKEAKAKG